MSIRSGELPKGHFGELTAEELMDFGIWCEEGKLVWDENEVEFVETEYGWAFKKKENADG
jgi:hypothetical protein